jgi:hypothetical protein
MHLLVAMPPEGGSSVQTYVHEVIIEGVLRYTTLAYETVYVI